MKTTRTWKTDPQYRLSTIVGVKKRKTGWEITDKEGWSFRIPTAFKEPQVEMAIRFYGEGIGRPVRGVVLDESVVVFYKTAEEQEEERKKPKNPDPQIIGFEWTDDMREISGFGGDYERCCRTIVSHGCKWFQEHPEVDPKYYSYKGIYGLMVGNNADAKALDKVLNDASESLGGLTGAMHQAAIAHIFLYKKFGSWKKYQEESRREEKKDARDGKL